MRDPLERLRDILEAAAAIQRHVPSNREAFDENEDAFHGVRSILFDLYALRSARNTLNPPPQRTGSRHAPSL